MKMEMAMAKEVAGKLEDRDEVLEANAETGEKGPFVECFVYSDEDKWSVKSDLHEYPVYVALEVARAR